MFEKLSRFLDGEIACKKCGRTFFIMSFGFGEGICPDCYEGEKKFIELDQAYLLNRILSLFIIFSVEIAFDEAKLVVTQVG
jgi:hypothetical protein